MAAKTRTKVWIAGREFQLSGDEPEAYVIQVARSVDKRMADIQVHHPQLSSSVVAVLAAVNATEELQHLQRVLDEMEAQYTAAKEDNKRLQALLDEQDIRLKELEQEILVLKAQKHDMLQEQEQSRTPNVRNLRRSGK